MSLTREHGQIVFVCDDCGEALYTGTSDFDDALQELRDSDWRAVKQGDWEHHCDECRGGRRVSTATEFKDYLK